MNPKIAIITPYYKEPIEMLRQAHESVLAQSPKADHFLIADGFPHPEIDSWDAKHITLPNGHADNGNTPRGIGALLAKAEGYDFIGFLDADNWYHPDHISSLYTLWQHTKAPVCASFRTFHRYDGSQLHISEHVENNLVHIDTSCYFVHRETFKLLSLWLDMPKRFGPICDRVYLAAIRHAGFKIAHSKQRTIAFRTQYCLHYEAAGEEPPPGSKTHDDDYMPSINYLRSKEGITLSVDSLGFWPLSYFSAEG